MATQFAFGKIVTDGLVLALDAADKNSYPGSGTTWRDVSGNNSSTLVGTPSFIDGNPKAISFDGSSKKADITTPFGKSGFTTVSVYYRRVEEASSTIWRTLLGTASTNIHHLISESSTKVLGIWDGSFRTFGYTPLIDGKFHNYVVIYNSTSTATLYVDGVFVTTISIILDLQTSPIGTIGNWAGGNYWAGYIGTTTIYNRELSASEILQNYNAQKSRFNL
jgi:hypothetical protein